MIAALIMGALQARPDWLVSPRPFEAKVIQDSGSISISNGLVQRQFCLKPDLATTSIMNLTTGEELVRAVKPEAELVVDGQRVSVGGLTGQPDLAFLKPEWLADMKADPDALHLATVSTGKTTAPFDYRPTGGKFKKYPWPAPGVQVRFAFENPSSHPGLEVVVKEELYDGLPLFGKWIVITNKGSKPLKIDSFSVEKLGLVEGASYVGDAPGWPRPNVTPFTDYAFGGDAIANTQPAVHWETDPAYATQVNYNLSTPCDLMTSPPLGPGVVLQPGQSLSSFRSYLLVQDSNDRERSGLALRKAYRTLAPWTQENPLMLHLTSTDPAVVKEAIDQAADVGFELVIFSFGSGLDMENVSPENIAKFKEFAAYAHKKGLLVGGYSLLASRHIDDANDVINPKTGKPGGAIFGYSPCLGSDWGIAYFQHLKTFLSETGFDMLEHDGSYPGDVCASTTHPGHTGLEDSQWTQFAQITQFYHWCRQKGIFLNVPDWYFLQGSNKSGMGYREDNWSLPRALQPIHGRQNMYDGTWEKAPSMGWMFVPLVQYHGGGAAATIEPLKDHLTTYRQHLQSDLGFGVQACYRGARLYDSPETRALVLKWVNWFKANRTALESDVVHWRRPNGRDLDGVLHVDPSGDVKGLMVIYNPTEADRTETVSIPLHYTGLRGAAEVTVDDGQPEKVGASEDGFVSVKVLVPAGDMAWIKLRAVR